MARSINLVKSETTSMRVAFKSLLFAAAIIGGIATAAPALAQTAEELRRDAAACEQVDGYMQALNPSAQAAVDIVNAQRREFYEMRSTEEGIEVAAVAAVFAAEIVNQPNYRGC